MIGLQGGNIIRAVINMKPLSIYTFIAADVEHHYFYRFLYLVTVTNKVSVTGERVKRTCKTETIAQVKQSANASCANISIS